MSKKYNVILADPPWKYDHDMPTGHRSTDHYPSMELDELKELGVPAMVDETACVLFMWATGPKLDWAIALGQAWGFKYSQVAFVWDKQRVIPGCYTVTECEFVLVFKKKRVKLPKRAKTNVRQFFQEKPREHSRKPEYVQDMIELMYPNTTKIELFARRTREGWDSYGNETTKFDKGEE